MRKTTFSLILLLAACATTPRAEPTAGAPTEPPSGTAREDGSAPSQGSVPDAVPEAPAAGPVNLTVPAAVELAMRKNPELGVAAARILAAEAAVSEARSAWYPTFGLSLGYTHSNDPVLVFMAQLRQRQLSFGGDFNEPGGHGNFRASAELGWLVWDGGRRTAREDLARIGVRLEEGARDAVLNELKAAVIQTSLAVFEAEEFIRVAEESVKLVEQELSVAQTRLEAGAAQRSDVLSVEVRFAEAREDLVRARNGRERALVALRSLLGLGAGEPFHLAPMGSFRVPPIEEADLLATARLNRPELRRARDAVVAAERAIGLTESDRMPTVTAFGSYDLDDEHGSFTLKQDSVTAGVRVDVNLFSGFSSEARIVGARARVREARAMERRALLAIEADVTRARLELEEARERLRVSEKTGDQAEEALHLIRARYENGAATITEYLDAEVALTGARVRNVTARFKVERATADLRRALGICRARPGGGEGGWR